MINLIFKKENEDLIPMIDNRIKKEIRNYQIGEQTNIIIYDDDHFGGWNYKRDEKFLFFSNDLFREFYKHFGYHRLNNVFLVLEEKKIDKRLFTRSSTSSYKNDIYLKIHRIILRIISPEEVLYDPFNIISAELYGNCSLKRRSKNIELLDFSRAAIGFKYEGIAIDPLFITLNTIMPGESENIINSKVEYYICYEEITHDIIFMSPSESFFIESLEYYYPHRDDQQKIISLLSTVYYDGLF